MPLRRIPYIHMSLNTSTLNIFTTSSQINLETWETDNRRERGKMGLVGDHWK